MQPRGDTEAAQVPPPQTCAARLYEPKQPEDGVLHRVLREHLESFLEEGRSAGDALPLFVERELREFLSCGILARGFARFRCDECGHELLVAFSCKGRGFCPSCCGRRMAELAAHLTDDVLGGLPVPHPRHPGRIRRRPERRTLLRTESGAKQPQAVQSQHSSDGQIALMDDAVGVKGQIADG